MVEKLETRALDWVGRRFDLFNPAKHASPRRALFVIKAAAELAMVCAAAKATGTERRTLAYRDLAERLWCEIFSTRPVRAHMLANIAAVPLLGIYSSMRQCGFDDPHYRETISRALGSIYLAAVERTPASQLDFQHSLRISGFASPDLASIYRRSLLGQHPPLYPLTNDDVYAITHALFFTTDFGRFDGGFFDDADRRYFASALPRLTDYYLRQQDWDLSAELLISLRCVGLEGCGSFSAGWELLQGAQNESGSYPGPIPNDDPDRQPVEADWGEFRDDYHTTLAVLLALLVAPPPAVGEQDSTPAPPSAPVADRAVGIGGLVR